MHTDQSSHHVSVSQDGGVCVHSQGREGKVRAGVYSYWTLWMSLELSVKLTEVQDLAGSEPYNESTVKLRGWFDCSSPLC